MKSILKTVFLVSFVTFMSIAFMSVTKAIETEDSLQVYHIRSENDKIITDKKLFSFYEQNNEKLAVLIEEKQRKEKEEAERLEAERLEAERLEAERIAKEEEARRQAENNKIDYSIANTIESNSEVANFAMQFVGNPYVYGGTSLTNGADCSGFVMAVYANFGISLPRTTGGQAQSGIYQSHVCGLLNGVLKPAHRPQKIGSIMRCTGQTVKARKSLLEAVLSHIRALRP